MKMGQRVAMLTFAKKSVRANYRLCKSFSTLPLLSFPFLVALACLLLETPLPRSFVVSERERAGETFVCKTCRGRSIHPFQKNNITFKWNRLEPPNPIFEPRSLSRTFPFWIFHSQQQQRRRIGVHISLGITVRPFDQQEGAKISLITSLLAAQVRKLSSFFLQKTLGLKILL